MSKHKRHFVEQIFFLRHNSRSKSDNMAVHFHPINLLEESTKGARCLVLMCRLLCWFVMFGCWCFDVLMIDVWSLMLCWCDVVMLIWCLDSDQFIIPLASYFHSSTRSPCNLHGTDAHTAHSYNDMVDDTISCCLRVGDRTSPSSGVRTKCFYVSFDSMVVMGMASFHIVSDSTQRVDQNEWNE